MTHYVADISKARALLDWRPQTPLDVGIPRAVAWFKEWRAAHPEEDRPFVRPQTGDEVDHGFKQRPSVRHLTSSRSSGRPRRARPPSPRILISTASARTRSPPTRPPSTPGCPSLTAAPPYPTELVGVVPLSESVSVGSYQRLAHAAIDRAAAAGRRALVVGGTGLYLRAALSELRLAPPPQPGERERWEEVYDQLGAERAHALLAERDPAAAARVHANDRRRVVRGARARGGRRVAGARARRPVERGRPPADASRRARRSARRARPPDRGSARRCSRPGARRRRHAVPGESRCRPRRAKVIGLEAVRNASRGRSRGVDDRSRPSGWPATSASGSAGFRTPLRSTAADRPRRSPMRSVALAGAAERLPRH